MENVIDLHTHTNKSDGTYTPNELLIEAENKHLEILSITDHETVEAYYDIDRSLFSGMIIPGIELRTSCLGVAIELLGYGFDIDIMRDSLKKYHYMNTQELDNYMINLAYEQYTKRGIKIDKTFIQDYNPVIFPRLSKYIQASVFRHSENEYLLKDIPEGKSFFRTCITNPKSPLFLDLSSAFPSASDLIKAIKNADGLVAIPHIFEYQDNAENILKELLENYDIDIIECYYQSFTKEQTNYLLNICKKYNKFSSGGSDFHGSIRPDVFLGTGKNNNLFIPKEEVNLWIHLLKNKF